MTNIEGGLSSKTVNYLTDAKLLNESGACTRLLEIVRNEAWEAFQISLKLSNIRSALYVVIDDLLCIAAYSENDLKLVSLLPGALSLEEGQRSIAYACATGNVQILKELIKRGGVPSPGCFKKCYYAYTAKKSTEFEYLTIKAFVANNPHQFRKLIGLNTDANSFDVIKRAQASSASALWVIAYTLMSKRDFIKRIRKTNSIDDLNKMKDHSDMIDGWKSYLNEKLKAEYLERELCI